MVGGGIHRVIQDLEIHVVILEVMFWISLSIQDRVSSIAFHSGQISVACRLLSACFSGAFHILNSIGNPGGVRKHHK